MSEEIQSYNYRPITRSEFELPEDYQIAVWIVINMEYFEYETPYPADGDKSVPNVMTYSWREYGSRVGIWRILKILDKYGVKPTLVYPGANTQVFLPIEKNLELTCFFFSLIFGLLPKIVCSKGIALVKDDNEWVYGLFLNGSKIVGSVVFKLYSGL